MTNNGAAEYIALESRLRIAEQELARARAKAELADTAQPMIQMALQDCLDRNLILHIPMHCDWLKQYEEVLNRAREETTT